MVEVASILDKPLILGAWMTRLWVLLTRPEMRVRATNDVDVGFETAVGYVEPARRALEEKGYVQDAGDYRFRFSRMTASGVLIVDLLIDEERASGLEPALPVFGMAAAAQSTVDASLRVAGIGRCEVRIPTLDGAFLLRALALTGGAGDLKFEDYAADAASLAQLLVVSDEYLRRWRARRGEVVARARVLALPLFDNPMSPGALAAARREQQDTALTARRVSAAIHELFDAPRRSSS
jgi:hypothetical protein